MMGTFFPSNGGSFPPGPCNAPVPGPAPAVFGNCRGTAIADPTVMRSRVPIAIFMSSFEPGGSWERMVASVERLYIEQLGVHAPVRLAATELMAS
jgi:hypothetical protein